MEIKYELTKTPKEKPTGALGFGHIFTDHMFVMDYDEGKGWHDARIVPYQPLVLDPSALVFHYAQECFEGLKAYRTPFESRYMPLTMPSASTPSGSAGWTIGSLYTVR